MASLQRVQHDAVGAVAIFGRLGDVEGVSAHPIAHDFGHDVGPAAAGKLQFFQHQNAGAFANHKSVASRIPGTAGLLGIVIPGGKRAHGGESADSHRSDGCFRAARDHYVSVAAGDDLESVADGVGARGTSRAGGLVRPPGLVADADMPGGQIDDRGGNEKRRDLARAAIQQIAVLALDHIESADSGSDVDADALGNLGRHLQARSFHGLIRRRHGQVDEASHLLQFFFLDELQGIEILDFGGNLAGKLGRSSSLNEPCLIASDAGHAALSGQQFLSTPLPRYSPPHRSGRSR